MSEDLREKNLVESVERPHHTFLRSELKLLLHQKGSKLLLLGYFDLKWHLEFHE